VIVDAHELKFLGGQANEDECIAELGASFPNATFVATLGPRGSVLFKGNVRSPVRGVDLASLGKKVVNSTGSGDAFLGVFASYLMEGEEPVEAVEWGNLAGALKAARYETRGSPRRGELENCMRALRKPTTTHRRSVD
jgi:sugar/nucleoside kinase (ribokinase family)